jgi:hypothetical protein
MQASINFEIAILPTDGSNAANLETETSVGA